jgi:translation elongation factor EF-4
VSCSLTACQGVVLLVDANQVFIISHYVYYFSYYDRILIEKIIVLNENGR